MGNLHTIALCQEDKLFTSARLDPPAQIIAAELMSDPPSVREDDELIRRRIKPKGQRQLLRFFLGNFWLSVL